MVDRPIAVAFAIAGVFWLGLTVLAWQMTSLTMIAIGVTFIGAGSILMAVRQIPAIVKVPVTWGLSILSMLAFLALTSSDARRWELLYAGTLVGTLAFGLWLVSGFLATRLARSR